MPSSKKGKNKKGTPAPAADPLSSPVASRRNDAGRLPSGYRVPQPSSTPPGDVSPAGSKGSQDLKGRNFSQIGVNTANRQNGGFQSKKYRGLKARSKKTKKAKKKKRRHIGARSKSGYFNTAHNFALPIQTVGNSHLRETEN